MKKLLKYSTAIFVSMFLIIFNANLVFGEESATLVIRFTCGHNAHCLDNKNIPITINGEEYKPTKIVENVATYKVPTGTFDYEIQMNDLHKAENLTGNCTLWNDQTLNVDINLTKADTKSQLSVKALAVDVNDELKNASMDKYNTTATLVAYGETKTFSVKLENGVGTLPTEMTHGLYRVTIPETDTVKAIDEDIHFDGENLVLHPDYKTSTVQFAIENFKDLSTSDVTIVVTNKTTKETKELNLNEATQTYIKLPYGQYNISVKDFGIFMDDEPYSKDITFNKPQVTHTLGLKRNAKHLNVNVSTTSRKAVPNTTIKVINENTGIAIVGKTDANGNVVFEHLEAGDYIISQMDTENINIVKSSDVEFTMTDKQDETLLITNAYREKVPVSFIPKVDSVGMSEVVSVTVIPLDENNKDYRKTFNTTGTNPVTLELPHGIYTVELSDLTGLTPVKHTVIFNLDINEQTPTSLEWSLDYETKQDNYGAIQLPSTGIVTDITTPVMLLVLIASSASLIYRRLNAGVNNEK